MARATPVDDDNWLVAQDPGIVPAGQRGNVAWIGNELRAVARCR
jgi:hypothetical protein